MSAPGAPHGIRQQEEAGGQPLVYGVIPDGSILFRSAHTIRGNGSGAPVTNIRVNTLEILNETDGFYYTIRCKNIDGVATLYLSDTGSA